LTLTGDRDAFPFATLGGAEMQSSRKGLFAAVLLTVVASTPTPEASAQSLTRGAEVYPLIEQGKLTGCQVAFSVARIDDEFSEGRPALANGLIILDASGRVALRLGVASDASLVNFEPPARAYLYGDFKSNVDDFVQRGESSEPGFALFVYRLGDPTAELLLRLMESGTIDILYAPLGATVEGRFSFDLGSQSEPYTEYIQCVRALFEDVN